ncbi:MAG TPA: ATP-binding protein [Candidatus Saccharimonadales bacterium]|nr:ATP-binding protein [Candidatus Saccharimonadales bacterium]
MRKKDTIISKLKKNVKKFDNVIHLNASLEKKAKERHRKLEDLQEKVGYENKKLKKIKTLAEHNHEIYSGLEELKNISNLSLEGAEKKALGIYQNEVKRLEELLEKYREQAVKEAINNPLTGVSKPKLIWSVKPRAFAKNIRLFRFEKNEYKEAINKAKHSEMNLTIGKDKDRINISSDGSKHYKPENAHTKSSHINIDDKLIATYYLTDVPAFLTDDVLFKLATSHLPFTISMFIEPSNSQELIKKAKERLSVLELKQAERVQKGKLKDQQTEKSIEEISQFIYELVNEYEKGFVYSFYLSLEAKNQEELKLLHKELKNFTDGLELTLTKYIYGQKKAFEATLPFNEDRLQQNRILQSSAVAYLTPFVAKQIHDPKGILLGVNRYHNSLVFVNPFTIDERNINNSNINIFGQSGMGKSVTAKLLAIRLYMRNTQIIIIDPEGEYLNFAQEMGGEVVDFSRKNGINPFSITSDDPNDILDHISVLKTFFKFFIRPQRYDGAVLDKVLVSLYKDYPKVKPNFKKFLKGLKKSKMYDDLAVLDNGSLRGVFNSEREIALDNDLIVFNLSSLGETEEKGPAMYLLTSLIWGLSNKVTKRKKMLFIDEAHNLLIDTDVAVFYRKLVKQARKRNMGVVSITQDIQDFLDNDMGKAIITNSETKILLKQSYATIPLMENIFPMTNEEKRQLGELEIGEIVLYRQNEHMRVDILSLPHEDSLIGMSKSN